MIVALVLCILLLCASLYLNFRWIRMLLRIEDNCNVAMDYMDARYKTINQLLHDTHLVANDEIAKQFVEEIKRSLNGILYATNVLKDPSADTIEKMIEEEEQEESDESEEDA